MSRASKLTLITVIVAMSWSVAPSSAQSVIDQYNKSIRPNMEIKPLGLDLFGDQISMLDGALSFNVTDVSVATDSGLPMTVGRTLSIQDQARDQQSRGVFRAVLGEMWELDVPYVKVRTDARRGWVGHDGSTNRCSKGVAAPAVTGLPPFGLVVYESEDYYSGVTANIPGYGEEILVVSSAGPMPDDGYTYVKSSKSGWRARCITGLERGAGEGFVLLLSDGTTYKFNWLVDRVAPYILDATCPKISAAGVFPSTNVADTVNNDACTESVAIPRNEYILYATEAKDRFGNTVTYTYDQVNPLRLIRIESSDGARININYSASGQVQTIVTGGRTWTYVYEPVGSLVRLKEIILPDQSRWSYEYGSNFEAVLYAFPAETWGGVSCVLVLVQPRLHQALVMSAG